MQTLVGQVRWTAEQISRELGWEASSVKNSKAA